MNSNIENFPEGHSYLSNDFVFAEVMRTEGICKCFLEHLLGITVTALDYPEKQKDLSDSFFYHGTRLDVFVKDSCGNAYNIEIQNTPVRNIQKRARFYTAAVDRDMLPKGGKYETLQKSVIIFVCSYDAFERGFAEYAVEKRLIAPGYEGSFPYDDGTQVYYLNAKYKIMNADAEITDFLDIICGKFAKTDFGKTVTDSVTEVLKDSETRRNVMTLEQRLRDERNWAIEQGREEWVNKGRAEGLDKGRKEGLDEGRKKGLDEGRKEGLNEGRAEAYAEIIRNMAASGVSQDQIAALTGIPLSKVHSFLNQ